MRGLKMSSRSVYFGLTCEKCAQKVKNGEPFLGTTLFVDVLRKAVRHFRTANADLEIRLVWHRRCMDRILENTPVDTSTPAFEEKWRDLVNHAANKVRSGEAFL